MSNDLFPSVGVSSPVQYPDCQGGSEHAPGDQALLDSRATAPPTAEVVLKQLSLTRAR